MKALAATLLAMSARAQNEPITGNFYTLGNPVFTPEDTSLVNPPEVAIDGDISTCETTLSEIRSELRVEILNTDAENSNVRTVLIEGIEHTDFQATQANVDGFNIFVGNDPKSKSNKNVKCQGSFIEGSGYYTCDRAGKYIFIRSVSGSQANILSVCEIKATWLHNIASKAPWTASFPQATVGNPNDSPASTATTESWVSYDEATSCAVSPFAPLSLFQLDSGGHQCVAHVAFAVATEAQTPTIDVPTAISYQVLDSVDGSVITSELLPSTRVDFAVPAHSGLNQIKVKTTEAGKKIAICGYAILVDETNAHCCGLTELILTPDRTSITVDVGGATETVNVDQDDTMSIKLGGPNACGITYTMSTSSTAGTATISLVGNKISITSTNPADIGLYTLTISTVGSPFPSDGQPVDFTLDVLIQAAVICTVLTVAPDSPVSDMAYFLGSAQLTQSIPAYTQTPDCGESYTYSCVHVDGTACPNWLYKNPGQGFQIQTTDPTLVGTQSYLFTATVQGGVTHTSPFQVTVLDETSILNTAPLNDMEYLLGAPKLVQPVPAVTQNPATIQTVASVCTFGPAGDPCPTWFWTAGATEFTVETDDELFVGLNEVTFTVQIGPALPHEFKFTVSIIDSNDSSDGSNDASDDGSNTAPSACALAQTKYLDGVDLRMSIRIGRTSPSVMYLPRLSNYTSKALPDAGQCGSLNYTTIISDYPTPVQLHYETETDRFYLSLSTYQNHYLGEKVIFLGVRFRDHPTLRTQAVPVRLLFEECTVRAMDRPDGVIAPLVYRIGEGTRIYDFPRVQAIPSCHYALQSASLTVVRGNEQSGLRELAAEVDALPHWIQMDTMKREITVLNGDHAKVGEQLELLLTLNFGDEFVTTREELPITLLMTLFDKEAEMNTPPYFAINELPELPPLSCEASDVLWEYQLPEVKDDEAHPYEVQLLLPEALEGYLKLDSSKMLIQSVEGQKMNLISRSNDTVPDSELIFIVLTDTVGLSNRYSQKVQIDCNSEALGSRMGVKPRVGSISNLGVVKIQFSHPLLAPQNLTKLQNDTVFVDGVLRPALEVGIDPGPNSNDYFLNFTWTLTDFTPSEMTFILNFTSPEYISINNIKESLFVTFWKQSYFRNVTDEMTYAIVVGETITKEIMPQLASEEEQSLVEQWALLGYILISANYLIDFLSGNVMSFTRSVQTISLMILIEAQMPAETQYYFKLILRVTAFNPIKMDGVFDSLTGLENEPVSTNFEALGYESTFIIRSMGSLCVIIVLLPIVYFATRGVLSLISCGTTEFQNKAHLWKFLLKQSVLWNGVIEFVNNIYFVVAITSFINLRNLQSEQSVASIINYVVAVVGCVMVICFPLVILKVYIKRWKNLQNDYLFLSKYGNLVKDVRAESIGKSASIALGIANMIRRLIFAFVIVFLANENRQHTQLLICQFVQFWFIAIFVHLMPFYGYLDNTLKMINEWSIFVFLVVMSGLQDEFNHVEHEADQVRKNCLYQKIMGISLVVVLLLQVIINLVIKVVTVVRDFIKKHQEKKLRQVTQANLEFSKKQQALNKDKSLSEKQKHDLLQKSEALQGSINAIEEVNQSAECENQVEKDVEKNDELRLDLKLSLKQEATPGKEPLLLCGVEGEGSAQAATGNNKAADLGTHFTEQQEALTLIPLVRGEEVDLEQNRSQAKQSSNWQTPSLTSPTNVYNGASYKHANIFQKDDLKKKEQVCDDAFNQIVTELQEEETKQHGNGGNVEQRVPELFDATAQQPDEEKVENQMIFDELMDTDQHEQVQIPAISGEVKVQALRAQQLDEMLDLDELEESLEEGFEERKPRLERTSELDVPAESAKEGLDACDQEVAGALELSVPAESAKEDLEALRQEPAGALELSKSVESVKEDLEVQEQQPESALEISELNESFVEGLEVQKEEPGEKFDESKPADSLKKSLDACDQAVAGALELSEPAEPPKESLNAPDQEVSGALEQSKPAEPPKESLDQEDSGRLEISDDESFGGSVVAPKTELEGTLKPGQTFKSIEEGEGLEQERKRQRRYDLDWFD